MTASEARTTGRGSSDRRLSRRLLAEARPYWPHLALLTLIHLLATPIALLTPWPLKIAVDSIAGSAPLPALYRASLPPSVLDSPVALLGVTGALMVAIGLANSLQGYGSWLLETYAGERLVLGFRAKLFRHAQRLSLSYHDRQGSADATYRIQHDAEAIHSLVVSGVIPFVTSIVTLVATVYVIGQLDPTLAVVAMCATPFLFGVTHVSVNWLKGGWKHVKGLESRAMAVVQEVLSSIRIVKSFSREDHEQARFAGKSRQRLQEYVRLLLLEMSFDLATATIIGVAGALTLAIGVLHVREGTLSLGSLLLISGYLGQLFGPLGTMSKKTTQLQSAIASAERAFALLDEAPDVVDRPDARGLSRVAGRIEFRDVWFGYEGEPPVLRHVSFSVPAGASVGIAGPTGAGKTTLLTLLMRFYDPDAGQIRIDDLDLRDLKLADLRQQFAIVHQDPVLFSASVRENILYGKPDASDDEIENAARAANAHEFITGLPDGYDTLVGERGMRLSGGERQRLALARAFLKDAPILLLDEPTSAVDVKTEAAIVDALSRLMKGRTTFMIAHRLSTLERCDILLELARGRVVMVEPSARSQITPSLLVPRT